MKITSAVKIFTIGLICISQVNKSYASILASPDRISDREKKRFETTSNNNQLENSNYNFNNVVFLGNNNQKENIYKIYGLAYTISLNSKINNFTNINNTSPSAVGEQIAKMLSYWPANTVFLALLYNDKKQDVFPKLVLTDSKHIIVSYNDGTLDAINKVSPIIAMFDITDDVPCEKGITQADNYWIGICKAISVANKTIRIESVGPRHDEPVVKLSSNTKNK